MRDISIDRIKLSGFIPLAGMTNGNLVANRGSTIPEIYRQLRQGRDPPGRYMHVPDEECPLLDAG